jgi:uncharacterized phage protein (TIGR02220 family)
MEVIDFILALQKMGMNYYKVWLPIILKFKSEGASIPLNCSLELPSSTYYRIINYGVTLFPNIVNGYELTKNRSNLILTKVKPMTNQIKEVVLESTEQTIKQKTKPKDRNENTNYDSDVYEEIIQFLNQATGKNYKSKSVINKKFITQRLNDGFSIDDFKQVISVKSQNWLGTRMEQFLRPETLFSNKFESYLNENVITDSNKSNLKNSYDQISRATEILSNQ